MQCRFGWAILGVIAVVAEKKIHILPVTAAPQKSGPIR